MFLILSNNLENKVSEFEIVREYFQIKIQNLTINKNKNRFPFMCYMSFICLKLSENFISNLVPAVLRIKWTQFNCRRYSVISKIIQKLG